MNVSKAVCKAFAGDFLRDDAPLLGRPDDVDGDQIETSKVKVLVAQSCLTLWDPVDCSPPGSSVHGIIQAGILEWVAIPFSREGIPFFLTLASNLGLLHYRQILYHLNYQESPSRDIN